MSDLPGLDDWLTREPDDQPERERVQCRECRLTYPPDRIQEHERECWVDYIAERHGFEECLIALVNYLDDKRGETRGPAHVHAQYARVERCLDEALIGWQRMERDLAQWDQVERGDM